MNIETIKLTNTIKLKVKVKDFFNPVKKEFAKDIQILLQT